MLPLDWSAKVSGLAYENSSIKKKKFIMGVAGPVTGNSCSMARIEKLE